MTATGFRLCQQFAKERGDAASDSVHTESAISSEVMNDPIDVPARMAGILNGAYEFRHATLTDPISTYLDRGPATSKPSNPCIGSFGPSSDASCPR